MAHANLGGMSLTQLFISRSVKHKLMTDTKRTVLYIEDNHDNRKLVEKVLKAAGFKVFGVVDGLKGLEFVKSKTPDLILIDLQLPSVDGYTITKELRSMPQLDLTPIVALSADVLKDAKEKSMTVGCNGFIQKPINVDLLPVQIESYFHYSA